MSSKRYPASKSDIIRFLEPFDEELKLMLEYYDHDRGCWDRQLVNSIRYVYPMGGEGTVIFSYKAPE
jgi:hypothetical protein